MIERESLDELIRCEQSATLAPDRLERGWQRLSHSTQSLPSSLALASGKSLALPLATWSPMKWLGIAISGVSLTAGGFYVAHHQTRSSSVSTISAATASGPRDPRTGSTAGQPAADIQNPSADGRDTARQPSATANTETERAESRSNPRRPAVETETVTDTSSSSFDKELHLLKAAKAAIDARDFNAAMGSIQEHTRSFPRGVFAIERESLRAIASCGSGDLARGQKLARAFARNYPASPMVDRVLEGCHLGNDREGH